MSHPNVEDMSGIVARTTKLTWNRKHDEANFESTMNHTSPPNRDLRSRKSFWSLVALAILFVGLTGYLTLNRLVGFGARQVSAAPPPSVPALPEPTAPDSTS